MKVIVLAGGFAKRMWPLTKDQPKHLLNVAKKPMLSYVLDKIDKIENTLVDIVYISTNARFKQKFEKFLDDYESELNLKLIIEDTLSEGEKLGSIGALYYLITKENIDDDLLIIGGDNLFEFDLSDMVQFFKTKGSDTIAVYDTGSIEKAKLYGVLDVDSDDKIINFLEKPKDPPSTLCATACYLLTKDGVNALKEYVDGGNNPDAMGFFVSWLIDKKNVYAYSFSGSWFDVGSFESLKEADVFYSKIRNNQTC